MTLKRFLKRTGSISFYDKEEQKEIKTMTCEFLTVQELYEWLGCLIAEDCGNHPVMVKVPNEDNEDVEYDGDYAIARKDCFEICSGTLMLEPLSAVEDSNIAKYIL